MYKWAFNKFLSKTDPEKLHKRAIRFLQWAQKSAISRYAMRRFVPKDHRLNVNLFNKVFPNPLGIAAGFDKGGTVSQALSCLGFGFTEVGTVTFEHRDGNEKPRIWREKNNCVRNYMGLPNIGGFEVSTNINNVRKNGFKGIIGASVSSLGGHGNLYAESTRLQSLFDQFDFCGIDYITVNISCPNVEHMYNLEELFRTIRDFDVFGTNIPIFIKLGPPMRFRESKYNGAKFNNQPYMNVDVLKEIIDFASLYNISGIIVLNTLPTIKKGQVGGRSGTCLKKYGLKAVRTLYKHMNGRMPIIGVGGISDYNDVLTYIKNGASLVQLYTSFIYEGPRLPAYILNDLLLDSDRNGWKSIQDLVGVWA